MDWKTIVRTLRSFFAMQWREPRMLLDAALSASNHQLSSDTAELHEDGNTMTTQHKEAPGASPPEPAPAPEPQSFATWHAALDEHAATRREVFSTMEADKLYSVYLKHFFSPVKAGGSEAEE